MSADVGLVVARYGEIALKGRNQPVFLRQLRRNMREALRRASVDAEVVAEGRRLHVTTRDTGASLEALGRVFGLTSMSPAVRVPLDIAAIQEAALAGVSNSGLGPNKSVRVRAHRSFKGFPYTSPEINRVVGEYIVEATDAAVDLSDGADFTVGVEIHQDHALVFAETVPGPGGLPVPLSGRVVVLMSAGLDSPVAAWMMMKRGCAVIPLHFSGSDEMVQRFKAICEVLQGWSQGWLLRPVLRSHQESLSAVSDLLAEQREDRWNCLFCKRAMVAEAERAAVELGAQAIVLGDSLGQVASQTLENMRVISAGTSLPIFRPLIGLDKVEIMGLARRIGTYDLSAHGQPPCRFLPSRPLTQASYDKFLALQPVIEPDRPLRSPLD